MVLSIASEVLVFQTPPVNEYGHMPLRLFVLQWSCLARSSTLRTYEGAATSSR